ncbi:MAG TPA: GC-type dockerin domain-anchored protein [Myxococcota bacterium]|nr:GC-type dockerin domain-anchored protein [Myxococcota bacterium]
MHYSRLCLLFLLACQPEVQKEPEEGSLCPREAATPGPGDSNGDGAVDATDLALLLGAWGSADPGADLNGDGSVDAADLAVLLGNWG